MFNSLALHYGLLLMFSTFVFSWHLDAEKSTLVEDVVGSYELNAIKVLVKNSTRDMTKKLDAISNQIKSNVQTSDQFDGLKTSIQKLNSTVTNNGNYVKEMYNNIRETFSSFMNKFTQTLSNLKLYSEHQSQQIMKTLRKTGFAADATLAVDCLDLYNLRNNASGTYFLPKFGIRVLCDMETDGGGWLVIQRRAKVTEQIDFQRDWFHYKEGFGDLDTEFWMGNDLLHVLTNQKSYSLRIEMEDFENGTFYASYSNFRVNNEASNYELEVGNYSGNATDAFSYHHKRQFSTMDRDNDNYETGSCSSMFSGGFWYDRCYDAHLNGLYPTIPDRKESKYITWFSRSDAKEKTPMVLINVVIKIRPNVN